jgi:SAM-dependent methyltransferase
VIAASAWRDFASWAAAAETVRAAEDAISVSIAMTRTLAGDCSLCGGSSVFVWNDTASPRENLPCRRCGCIGRQRATAALLLESLQQSDHARIYATEQASPFFVALQRRVGQLHGSEFEREWQRRLRLSQWLWRQGTPGWVRFGDVTALPFRDAMFDGVVSQDVLEHVPDHRAGLREIARVLKPGAAFVFTVPFYDASPHNVRIATIEADGGIEHLAEPEYHGDPISGGVLCFHHFGWALLDDVREAGFADVAAYRVQDMAHALPYPHWILRAIR